MSEVLIIKCRLCKQSFSKDQIGVDPVVMNCTCENLTIEIKHKENENKKMFLVKFKEREPFIKIK